MDPIETLRMMCDALTTGDKDAAAEHAEDLITWLDRDGVAPLLTEVQRKTALYAWCDAVVQK